MTGPEFGIPGDVYNVVDPTVWEGLDEVLDFARAEGRDTVSAGITWLRTESDEGRVPRVVVDHIDEWNRLKATSGSYIIDYELYRADRLGD